MLCYLALQNYQSKSQVSQRCLQADGELDGDVLLVESDDEEGLDATAADMAARRAFAMQHDSLFGLDSQSQQFMPMPSLSQKEHVAKASCIMTLSCSFVHRSRVDIGPLGT